MAQIDYTMNRAKVSVATAKTLHVMRDSVTMVALCPHWRTFRKGTYWPMKRILESGTDDQLREELQRWFKYKEHESGYVQVAGAVIFATVTSCLSWNSLASAHWSGPALWYGTILLAVTCIFTGAQQTLVLSEVGSIEKCSSEELERMKQTFVHCGNRSPRMSGVALFAWQIPIMLLGYAVISFIAGLCSVVLSPLGLRPVWNDEAKTAVLFLCISAFCLVCWLFPSAIVHRIRRSR